MHETTAPRPALAEPSGDGTASCPNCGADRLGDYCHGCGQHYLGAPVTLRLLWREVAERVLKLERGLLVTVRDLTVSPGAVARRYLGGQRRRYVNPLSYLLIGAAVTLLVLPRLYAATLTPEMMGQLSAAGIAAGGADPGTMTPEVRAYMEAYQTEFVPVFAETMLSIMLSVYSVLLLAWAVALGGAFRLFFGDRAPRRTFAESLVPAFYAVGHYALLFPLVAAVVLATSLSGVAMMGISMGVLIGIVAAMALGLYGRTWGTAALALVAFAGSYAVFLVAVTLTATPLAFWLSRDALPPLP